MTTTTQDHRTLAPIGQKSAPTGSGTPKSDTEQPSHSRPGTAPPKNDVAPAIPDHSVSSPIQPRDNLPPKPIKPKTTPTGANVWLPHGDHGSRPLSTYARSSGSANQQTGAEMNPDVSTTPGTPFSTTNASKASGNTTPQHNYTQARRPMAVMTPLGRDQLLLVGLSGHDEISRLFSYTLDLLAINGTAVPFEKLLGQDISIRLSLANGEPRFVNGICCRVAQAGRDETFTSYRLEVVPKLWLLTHNVQSRIFQQISVPDILKKVLDGLDVAFEIQGTFEPRDYCVQYRESDFAFASRLMEEEGIYYFFRHTAEGHKLVLANTPQSHTNLPVVNRLIYEMLIGGKRPEDRVFEWEKTQELRSGKVTLWDHTFELPHRHLESSRLIQDSVKAGKILHPFKLPVNSKLELYDYPGEYAQRFDGITPAGGKRSEDLQKIFQDNQRTTRIRMEQETVPGLVVRGESNCRQLVSGHRFNLERHFDADGQYVLTTVKHSVTLDDYRSDSTGAFKYSNEFTCIPFDLPYRPQQLTEKPTINGTQTAVVVGPPGEEIWPDQYSRVKVQFHWDREGKNDLGSSCWVRVSTPWAGKQWGMIHIPRIGQEVIVAFEEGDPDRPIIVGSVYNYEQMPPFTLPENKTQSGIKSRTHKGQGYNEIVLDDTAGKEQIRMHGQYNMDTVVKNNQTQAVGVDRQAKVGNNETTDVGNNQSLAVGVNKKVSVGANHDETVGVNQTIDVGTNQSTKVGTNQSNSVGLMKNETVGVSSNEMVGVAKTTTVGAAYALTVGAVMNTAVGFMQSEEVGMNKKIIVGSKFEIVCGASKIVLESGGKVTIQGSEFCFLASGPVKFAAGGPMDIDGSIIDLN